MNQYKKSNSLRTPPSVLPPPPSVVRPPHSPPRTLHSSLCTPHSKYLLRQGLGFWHLKFAGQPAVFKHEQGAAYVANLLLNPPPQPIHALDLATSIAASRRDLAGITEIVDPATGRPIQLLRDARIQERSLGLEEAQTMRAVLRKQHELETLMEDEDQIEPVKAEAIRELETLYAYETKYGPRVRDSAQKAADAVGKAIKRFYQHLATATDPTGDPHPVLTRFAAHLNQSLLIPSGRDGQHGGTRPKKGLGGGFIYRPPAGVRWVG